MCTLMRFDAIALDLDGTVLDDRGNVSDELVNLFHQLRSKGIKIFIATGRTRLETAEALPETLAFDGMVTANGMVCNINDQKISSHTLDPELVKEVVLQASENKVYYEVHPLEKPRYALLKHKSFIIHELEGEKPSTLHDNEYNARLESINKHLHWLNDIDADQVIKVYFFSMDLNKITNWKNTLDEMKEKFSFSVTSSSIHSTEIAVPDVSKASGIQTLLQQYELSPEHLLAVGDAENDIPMLKLAGWGVAMKNANEHVKQIADEVTSATYTENGLYLFLKEKFKHILDS